MKRLVPRVETLKIGPSTDSAADYGPLVTQQALERVRNYVEVGIKEGATLAVDGRSFKMQGYENGFYMGGCLFDNVTKDMRIYKEEIFGPVLSVVRPKNTTRPWRSATTTNMAMGSPSSPATATPRTTSRQKFRSAWWDQCADPSAARLLYLRRMEAFRFRQPQSAQPRSIRFYTKTKTVTSRWPSGVKEGASFTIPVM